MPQTFDLATVPFSRFGSWMSISIPRDETELFFRNCHNGPHNVFPIRLICDGETVTPRIEATPSLLTLTHGAARVEICFASADTVRMRGQSLSLQLGDRNLVYSEAPNRVVINHRIALRRYQIEVLQGSVTVDRHVPTQPLFPCYATIAPDADGRFDLAIDEFSSTWAPRERYPFDQCLSTAEAVFRDFLRTMPPARPEDADARELATYVDWSCTVAPCGLLQRPTLLMSKNWMCSVWSWDQCFNAMALAAGQPDLALDQMLILADHQDAFGSYPDAINDISIHYNYSKPPVHGWAFREILRRLPRPPAAETLRTMYRSLANQAEWWMTHRRNPGERLPYYLHGNDSGWDNSTMFDDGVPLVAPDLAAFLVLQMETLSELADQFGDADEARDWAARAAALQQALLDELWRGDHFVARHDDADVASRSLIPWLPIILGERLPKPVRACLRDGIATHLTEWGLATEQVDSDRYDPDGYWQGPIWAPSTCIAVAGLDRCGFTELADTIAKRFCRLCGRSGFAENFDALTGAGLRDRAYTWTASVFLLLAERMHHRQSA